MCLQAWVATRKGLFELTHQGPEGWALRRHHFIGDPVSMVLPAGAGHAPGRLLAALNLGHFGVKLQASDDGGDSWQRQDKGLPHSQAWWTVKRQAMTADASSEVGLYFGTTSGELWHSRDEGKSWYCLARHLPEIYAVEAAWPR